MAQLTSQIVARREAQARRPVRKVRLLGGTHTDNDHSIKRRDGEKKEDYEARAETQYSAGDVFLTDKDLPDRWPTKFAYADTNNDGASEADPTVKRADETYDEYKARMQAAMDRELQKEASPPVVAGRSAADQSSLDGMTVKQLIEWAEENEYDVAGKKTKDEILKAIKEQQGG